MTDTNSTPRKTFKIQSYNQVVNTEDTGNKSFVMSGTSRPQRCPMCGTESTLENRTINSHQGKWKCIASTEEGMQCGYEW